jgi:hypothetical protein
VVCKYTIGKSNASNIQQRIPSTKELHAHRFHPMIDLKRSLDDIPDIQLFSRICKWPFVGIISVKLD